jgi:hypothetical protein
MSLFAIAVLGCGGQTSGEQPDQLEAPEAVYDQGEEYEAASIAGDDATVSGADRDWSVAVNAGATVPMVAFHVPGASDLSVLEGASLDIELGAAWSDDTRTVRIDDENGPRFLVQTSDEAGPATDLLGASFVAFGDEIGTGTMKDDYGNWEVSYKTAVFETDDGAVEANPGEPFVATIDGEDWRVVVHASFEVTKTPDSIPGCGGGIGTTLSFEMLRIDTPPALDAVTPLAGARQAGFHSCG